MSADTPQVTTEAVRDFWEQNPLCAGAILHPRGSRKYFAEFDAMRERIEPPDFARRLHEFPDYRGKRVLDVGCGNGYVLSRYAAEGADVSGIDLTSAAVELSRRRFELHGLTGDFRVADAESLPFEDASFDCACSMGVLHHVPDTAKAVAELHRVLKPGGRLIVMFYHRNSAKYQWAYRRASWRFGKSLEQLVNEFDGAGNPKGTVYSKRELTELLSRCRALDLSVGYLEARDVVPFVGKLLPDRLFSPLAGLIGWNLYAKGRK